MTRTTGCVRAAQSLCALLAAVSAGCGAVPDTGGAEVNGTVTSGLTTAARHSLVITAFNVVANPARTVEPCLAVPEDADTKRWSLPYLLKVAAGRNGKDPAEFVTNWLNAWKSETPLVNGQTGRANGVQEVMDRWPRDPATNRFRIEKAPFRLSAIVSRLDLRNLRPEGEPLGGEVRFVFGLTETTACASQAAETTIILEYSPRTTTENDVLSWGKRWYALGNLDKNSEEYLTALQSLTESTIRTGKLERIRTNAVRTEETVVPGWFLNEFVPVNGWLVRSTVKQTPRHDLRNPRDSNRSKVSAFIVANESNLEAAFEAPQKGYMYNPRSGYRVPDKFDGTDIAFRGAYANAVKTLDLASFWDFPKPASVGAFTWSLARHRFSLGTCSGCHGAEMSGQGTPGVLFHIRPRTANGTAPLSSFLSGPVAITDPVDGTVRHYDEVQRRQDDLHWLANEMPLGTPMFGNYYKMRFVHSAKCMDLEGESTSTGAPVKQYTCHGKPNQRLAFVPTAQSSEFKIKFKHSQLCLDVENGSTANGAKVVQKTCASSNSQVLSWFVPPGAPEAILLTFKHSGKCVRVDNQSSSDGTSLIQTDCSSDRNHGLHLVE